MDIIKKQVDELMDNQTHILAAIKYLDERMKVIENTSDKKSDDVKEIVESQTMIDELVVKNSDDILVMKRTKEKNADAIKDLETKMDRINQEIELKKKKIMDKVTKEARLRSETSVNSIQCNYCDKHFERFVDLENYIKEIHGDHKEFQCDKCKKFCVLKWRLKKHMKIHEQKFVQYCHYFNNGKMCPFDELGCKYLHALAKTCKLGQNCNKRLCPNRHVEDEVDITSDNSIINDNENCSQNSGHDSSSFVTSTPQKKSFQCEE